VNLLKWLILLAALTYSPPSHEYCDLRPSLLPVHKGLTFVFVMCDVKGAYRLVRLHMYVVVSLGSGSLPSWYLCRIRGRSTMTNVWLGTTMYVGCSRVVGHNSNMACASPPLSRRHALFSSLLEPQDVSTILRSLCRYAIPLRWFPIREARLAIWLSFS